MSPHVSSTLVHRHHLLFVIVGRPVEFVSANDRLREREEATGRRSTRRAALRQSPVVVHCATLGALARREEGERCVHAGGGSRLCRNTHHATPPLPFVRFTRAGARHVRRQLCSWGWSRRSSVGGGSEALDGSEGHRHRRRRRRTSRSLARQSSVRRRVLDEVAPGGRLRFHDGPWESRDAFLGRSNELKCERRFTDLRRTLGRRTRRWAPAACEEERRLGACEPPPSSPPPPFRSWRSEGRDDLARRRSRAGAASV